MRSLAIGVSALCAVFMPAIASSGSIPEKPADATTLELEQPIAQGHKAVVLKTVDASGATTTFDYDAVGLLETVTVAGAATMVLRDGNGAATAIRSPAGVDTLLEIGADQLTSITRPDGWGSELTWANGGLLAEIRGHMFGGRSYTFDELGCARADVCGDGMLDAGEACDDGDLNSDTASNACRLDCRLPSCGDGIVDDGELCDDGAAVGAGMCNSFCTGFEPMELSAFIVSDLANAPPGSIGLLMDQQIYEPICLAEGFDFEWYDDMLEFLQHHDFIVGLRVQLAEDLLIERPVALYPGGDYMSHRAIRLERGWAEPLTDPRIALAGDMVVVGIVGGTMGSCECSTGGSIGYGHCSEEPTVPGGDPCPGGPVGKCFENYTHVLQGDSSVPTVSGELASLQLSCGNQCGLFGLVTDCDPENVPPTGLLDELPDNCSLPPGRVDPICQTAGVIDGSISNCWCRGQEAGQCFSLGEPGPDGRLFDECAFQLNLEGGCYQQDFDALLAHTDEILRPLLAERPSLAWAFCTSTAGRERCAAMIGTQPGLPDQVDDGSDDSLTMCTTLLRTDNVAKCMVCADRAGGACLMAMQEERREFLETTVTDMFDMRPTSQDTSTRRALQNEGDLRVGVNILLDPRKVQEVADPVILATGELSMSATDISFPSKGVPFELTRFYRSGGDWYGTMGPGWTHSYEEVIEPIGYLFNRQAAPSYCTSKANVIGCLLRHRADGGSELYVYDHVSGVYLPPPGAFGTMRVLTDENALYGYELFEPGGTTRRYDPSGVLRAVKDAEGFGVELHWSTKSVDDASRDGCGRSQKPHGLFTGYLAQERSALSASVKESIHYLCMMELQSVTDSYGRELKFHHDSRNGFDLRQITRHGPYNRSVLESVSYDGETLVRYEYTPFAVTEEVFLTRVVRTGMSDSMEPATPIVTEYDYQHDVIDVGGALAPGGALRSDVEELFDAAGMQVATCAGAKTVGSPIFESFCSDVQIMNDTAGIEMGVATDFWAVIYGMIADNIVRVRRGGSQHEDTELESFFDPDPTSADFDRVVKQRYGADPGDAAVDAETDIFRSTGAELFAWQTSGEKREARLFQVNTGVPSAATLPLTSSDRRNRFTHEARTLPDEVLAIPIAGHFAPEDDLDESCDLDALEQMPFFRARAPAGSRQDQRLEETPTIKRTPHSCPEIAGRHARDAFLNDMHDVSGVDETRLSGKRRAAVAWDAALICRWAQLEDRRGKTTTYGLNYMGQTLVEARPSPTGTGFTLTKLRYNADGLVVREEMPDGSALDVEYGGQSGTPGSTLFRGLPIRIVETPSAAGAVVDVGGSVEPVSERVTTFTYEPLFQQLSSMIAPDLTVTRLFYDYQQMAALDPLARALVRKIERSTGRTIISGPFGPFLNQDLDGDGRDGNESSSGLVLTVVEDVDVGGAIVDVGERITRDDCGNATDAYRIADKSNAALDTDRVHFSYYKDLADAEAGTAGCSTCRCALGPLRKTVRYRSPDATAPEDLDELRVAYDRLGGVKMSVANDQPETEVITQRNSAGLVIEEMHPNDLRVTRDYDARGQLLNELAADLGTEETLRAVSYAWGNQGVALGSCRRLSLTGCADFQQFARGVLRVALYDEPVPDAPADSSFAVALLDAEDYGVGSIDAAGGRVDRILNDAALVVEETVRGTPGVTPDVTTTIGYDAMARPIAETRGGLLERFFRYDGFGRLTDVQANAPLAETAFNAATGTVATTRYDLLDRPTTSFVVGDSGAGARRFLGMTRSVLNELGAPLFIHALAQSTLPATEPALPSGGIASGDIWATEELTYDHALRVSSHLPEGRAVAMEASYDGFGLATVDAPTRSVAVTSTPRARQRLTEHFLIAERSGLVNDNAAAQRSYSQLSEWDAAGNTTSTTVVDNGNGVPRISSALYDALGRVREAVDPTGRRTTLIRDLGGRVTTRSELIGLSTTPARSTSYAHDALGRVVVESPQDAPDTLHGYDAAGRRTSTESGDGCGRLVTDWRFDAAGRLHQRERLRACHPGRTVGFSYPVNRAAPSAVVVDGVTAKSWTRDGLERPVTATDENVGDGDAAFNASRPTLTTRLRFDALGRVIGDETRGTFPVTSPTLPGAENVTLSRLIWTRAANFLGPVAVATRNGEEVAWGYSPRGTLHSITRSGVAGTRVTTAALENSGGLWTRASVAPDELAVTKTRDALGFVTESSIATKDELFFQEDVLRGPTGRITAERRDSALFGARARSFSYDPLQRLGAFRIDTSTAMTREAFLAETSTALSDEPAGFGVVTAPDASVSLRSTKADFLLAATADHEGRGYAALGDPTAAGVPPVDVNALGIKRDGHDRIADDTALTYTWDVFDRLVLVTRDGDEELRIAYDGLGRRRLERRLTTGPNGDSVEDAVLEYAGGNVIEEYDVDDGHAFLTVTHAPGLDTPLIVAAGPTALATPTWMLGSNARGDATSAIDLDALVVDEEAILDPWGEREVIGASTTVCVEGGEATVGGVGVSRPEGGCAGKSVVLQRFGLAGARLHARTKLVDLRNRVYATHTRSFLTKDPLGNIDSEGLWNYVAGDPINFRDPWGLQTQQELSGAQGPPAPLDFDDSQKDACSRPNAPSPCVLTSDPPAATPPSDAPAAAPASAAPASTPTGGWETGEGLALHMDRGVPSSDMAGGGSGTGASLASGDTGGDVVFANNGARRNTPRVSGGLRDQREANKHRNIREAIKQLQWLINRYRDPQDPYVYKPPPRISRPGSSPFALDDVLRLHKELERHMERPPHPNSPLGRDVGPHAAQRDRERGVNTVKIWEEGVPFYDTQYGTHVYVRGNQAVVVDPITGVRITVLKNSQSNTERRIAEGRWIPILTPE